MKTNLLYVIVLTTFLSNNLHAQLIPGDVNKPVNQVYALGAANYFAEAAPTFVVTAPTTCAGTGSVTITWPPSVITAAKNRRFIMHGGLNYSNALIPGVPALTLNQGNGFSATFSGLVPGTYTFAVNRDPIDDDLTTNNIAAGAADDYTIGGWNDPTSDQSRCAVLGLTLLPVNVNNLTTCTIGFTNASDCTTANGTITISGLLTNTNYNHSYLVNGAWSGSVNSGATGSITIPALLTGIYPVRIRVNGEVCFRQFNLKVGNNSGIECFADNQLIDPSLGSTMVTNGNFGVGAGTLPTNGTTDYSLIAWSSGEPQDSRYALDDTTNHRPNGIITTNNFRLRNLRYPTDNVHLWGIMQRTGDHTGSLNQNNGNTGLGQGYKMIVNANYRTDRVINISNNSLVSGRSYIFSFWAKNLQPFVPRNKNNGTSLNQTYQPIIPKLALAVNGIIYDFADMRAILEPASYTGADTALIGMGWEEYNLRFIAPVTNSSSNITIYNFQQGGYGNDFAIDDVQLLALSVIGDRIWNDLDKDGIQDLNEPGMANVTATLLDNSIIPQPLQTTISDAFGYYQFANVSPAPGGTSYRVQFTLPNGYSFTRQTGGGGAGNGVDSDPDPVTGITAGFTIATGETEVDVDCGLIFDQPLIASSISDYVWMDDDNNGIQNTNENGLGNVTVLLYNNAGAVINTTISDINGYYRFNNLPAGNYRLGITQPPGTICTGKDLGGNDNLDSDLNTSGPNIRQTDLIVLAANQQITNVDIGLATMPVTSSSFGDFCWIDLNANGIQNSNEPGLPGVRVVLYQPGPDNLVNTADDIAMDSMFTDAFGKWQFTSLTFSRYYVRFYPVAGYSYTLKDVGSNDEIDSDINGTGFSAIISINNVPNGFNYEILDVGFVFNVPVPNAGRISDFFWNDINGNGVQNAGEFGMPGITVELLNNAGVVIATTTTNLLGNYIFTNVVPANYFIRFSNIPEGYQFTAKDLGGNDNLDSDIDIITGQTNLFTLSSNQVITNMDGGMRKVPFIGNSTVANVVWYDLDNNGIQDANETGVPNIYVTIREAGIDGIFNNADDVIRSTFTNALGQFMFNGLANGLYRVEFSLLPAGLTLSPKDAGIDDNMDSDGNAIVLSTSITDNFTLLVGEDKVNIGLGLVPSAASNMIGNRVWSDTNGNGLQDAGENNGVQSVVVQLLDNTGALIDRNLFLPGIQPYQTVSNPAGFWSFIGIPDGTYIPRFSFLPPGFRVTSSKIGSNNTIDSDVLNNGRSAVSVTLNAGLRVYNDIDLGLVPQSAVLGDYVWNDVNGDGIQGTPATEEPLSGVTATIYNSSNVALGAAVTDAAGRYYFPNVPPGNYYLRFSNYPLGMEFTIQESNPFATNGSNVDPVTGLTNTFNLASFGDTLHIDAGLKTSYIATVGDFVWFDQNNNGIQEPSEMPLAGVQVGLRSAGKDAIIGTADDRTFGRVTTDGAGFYQFTFVPAGNNYYVRFRNIPPSSAFAPQNNGSGSNDSRPNAGGFGPAFNLAVGSSNQNQDAGIINISILDLQFISFSAAKNSGGVLLNWELANPEEVVKYEIFYSNNGVSFSKIATIPNNFITSRYTYLHTNPQTGNNYYKIVAYNLFNKAYQSNLKMIKYENQTGITIFPNPVKDDLFVTRIGLGAAQMQYRIMDVYGKTVLSASLSNQTIHKIDLAALPAGSYVIIISDNNKSIYQKNFIKQH